MPTDVAMVVEVADSSLLDDRQMAGVYGGAGYPSTGSSTWLTIRSRSTLAHRGRYGSRVDYKSGDFVPVVIGGTIVGQIAVDDIISYSVATAGSPLRPDEERPLRSDEIMN